MAIQMQSISSTTKPKQLLVVILLLSILFNPMILQPLIMNSEDFIAKAVSHVPPEDAPTFNETFNWDDYFNTSTGQQPTFNLSYPPTTDFLPLFGSGLVNPNELVFTVTPTSPPRYWRLETYDYFDGHSWNKTMLDKVEKQSLDSPTGETEYTIVLNLTHTSTDSRYIPTLWPKPLILSYNSPDAFLVTFYEDDYDCLIMDTIFTESGTSEFQFVTASYSVDLDSIKDSALPPEYTPQYIKDKYLQVPSNLDPSVQAFSSQFSGLSGDTFYRAMIIMAYFRTHFYFDYDIFLNGGGPSPDEDVVAWFLNRGGGTSAHFATAFAITLRLNGIAARPVFGFTPGFVEGDVRKVYVLNFHVWVDVWVPTPDGGMWVQFDPTPLPKELLPEEDENVVSITYELNIVDYPPFFVNRNETFSFSAQVLQNKMPAENISVRVYDLTENMLLSEETTNSSGLVTFNITFDNNFVVGQHNLLITSDFASNYTVVFLSGNTSISIDVSSDKPLWGSNLIISGKLFDPLNGKGVSGQNVSIFFDGNKVADVFTDDNGQYKFPIYMDPYTISLGNHTVNVVFMGNLTLYGSDNNLTVTVETKPILLLNVDKTRVERGKSLMIYGSLVLINDTVMESENVEIHWINTTDNIISIQSTDHNGAFNFTYNISPDHEPYQVRLYAFFDSSYPYILDSTSTTINVIIYMNVTITVSVTPHTLNHTQQFTINGTVYDDKGNPLPDVELIMLFNNTALPIMGGTSARITSNSDGTYSITLNATTDLTGLYIITASVTSNLYEPFSDSDYIEVWSFTKTIIIERTPSFTMPGEQVNVTAVVIDDNNQPVPGNLTVYVNGVPSLSAITTTGAILLVINVPDNYTQPTMNISLSFNGKTYYWSSSSSNVTVFIFKNATITLNVSPYYNVSVGDTLYINGTVLDEYNRPINDRMIQVFINTTNSSSPIVIANLTIKDGTFNLTYIVPQGFENQTIAIYAVLVGRNVLISSESKNIHILAEEKEQPQPSGGVIPMQLDTSLLYYLLPIIALAAVAIILYKYPHLIPLPKNILGALLGRRSTVPPEIRGMLKELASIVETERYRDGIFIAHRILLTILTQFKGETKASYETFREYLYRVAAKYGISVGDVEDFLVPYEKAKFSTRAITKDDYIQTIQSFARLYSLLTGEEFVFA